MTEADLAYRRGQRLFLAAIGGPLLLLCAAAAAYVRFQMHEVNVFGSLVIAMLVAAFGLPYLQWIVAIPLAGVLHVQGHTHVARGVLRACLLLFLGYGLMLGFCAGIGAGFLPMTD